MGLVTGSDHAQRSRSDRTDHAAIAPVPAGLRGATDGSERPWRPLVCSRNARRPFDPAARWPSRCARCWRVAGSPACQRHPKRRPRAPIPAVSAQGAVGVATKNTTRLGGADPVSDAAAVARAVYPGLTTASGRTRSCWWTGTTGRPRSPPRSSRAPRWARRSCTAKATRSRRPPSKRCEAMHPRGRRDAGRRPGDPHRDHRHRARRASHALAARLGRTSHHGGRRREPALLAHGGAAASGDRARRGQPRALQMPAAGLAAESGAPILLVTPGVVPAATATVLGACTSRRSTSSTPQAVNSDAWPHSRASATSRRSSRGSTTAEANNPVRERDRRRALHRRHLRLGRQRTRPRPGVRERRRGRWTRPPPRCSRRSATTGRCCCSKAPMRCRPRWRPT